MYKTTPGTAGYFQHLGLLSKDVDAADQETEINILMNMAIDSLVFLPFGYLVDKYRWDLYSGVADESSMNCHWVKLRMDIQGDLTISCIFTHCSLAKITYLKVLLHQTREPRMILMPDANTMWQAMWDM